MRAVHGRRGKGTEGGKPVQPEPMPRIGAFDLPSAAAALHDGADETTSCDWLIPGLVREPALYPELSALPSASRFIRQSLQKTLPTLSTTSSNACNSIL
jgi:hypothetical protein